MNVNVFSIDPNVKIVEIENVDNSSNINHTGKIVTIFYIVYIRKQQVTLIIQMR